MKPFEKPAKGFKKSIFNNVTIFRRSGQFIELSITRSRRMSVFS
uniref:Uncharacterized protein n=1 Tax=Anguilla anguilla TaxID=7936 RepID=A0A0E9QMI7_ANGAN